MLHDFLQSLAFALRRGTRLAIVAPPGSEPREAFSSDLHDCVFTAPSAEADRFALVERLLADGRAVYLLADEVEFARRAFERWPTARLRSIVTASRGAGVPNDLATLRTLPHATLIAPATAAELDGAIQATLDHAGPVHFRLAETYATVTTDTDEFLLGHAAPLRDGHDALVVTTGGALGTCLAAADLLAIAGRDVSVLHSPTVQPLDTRSLIAGIERVALIVTVEEHGIVGGLGSAVAEFLAEAVQLGGRTFRRVRLAHNGGAGTIATPGELAVLISGMLSGLSRRHLGNQRSSELWPVFDRIS